jgi:UDP-3-O-[3-hydroxymyristoyl] N-acetylglucosamine deacetylase / 3-hydroxyacyl-[acyl-carrier-protein] dehydratase
MIPSIDASFTCYNRKSLEKILPHRGNALRKIDGVFHCSDTSETMLGVKEVSADDQDLEGHFPGAPTYPGYAQDEFVCLVAAALVSVSHKGLKTNPHVVQKVVRYKKNAVPGDILIAEVKLTGRKGRFILFSGEIRNQCRELVADYEKIVGAI